MASEASYKFQLATYSLLKRKKQLQYEIGVFKDDNAAENLQSLLEDIEELGGQSTHESEKRVEQSVPPVAPKTHELRALYIQLVKEVHPDTGTGQDDKALRTAITQELNEAYSTGSSDRMVEIVNAFRSDPSSIQGDDLGSQLIRLIRSISLTTKLITETENDLEQEVTTEEYQLANLIRESSESNGDYLQEIVSSIEAEIDLLEAELELLYNSTKSADAD